MAHLEEWFAHLDAQRFGFIAAAHHTAIVVAEHHDRQAAQLGPEEAFAADIEVVAIDQGVHGHLSAGEAHAGCGSRRPRPPIPLRRASGSADGAGWPASVPAGQLHRSAP